MTLHKAILIAPLCAFSMLMPGLAHAQSGETSKADEVAHDEFIVVTANRTPVRLDQVGQSVTVLTESAIEQSQQIGVTEILAQTPGVQFSRNGGRGATTSVYIRGAETGQTVILYDGVRIHDPSTTDGGASLTDVMTGDIGRIEVLRGAQSTLYGSQAIGGVINIISKTPDEPFEGSVQAEAGEQGSYLLRGGAGGKNGGLTWRVGAGYTTTDGVSAYSPGTERDGYENVSVNGRLSYEFSDNVSVDLRSYYSDGEAEFDSFNADGLNRGETETWTGYAGLNFQVFEMLENRVAYTRTDISRTNFDGSDARAAQPVTFDATGSTDRLEYQGTIDVSDSWMAVFGVDYAENEMRTASPSLATPSPVPLTARDDTLGIYGQLQFEPVDGLTLTGGLRQEDHSAFGGSTVGSASLAYTPNDGVTVVRASWGEGFKAPSLYQLYSEYGNPGLAPEQAESWDVGIEQWLFHAVSLSAVYFQRDSDDLINFAYCSATPDNPLCSDGRFGYYENVDRADTEGVELGTSIYLGAFQASANYTWLDAVNSSPGDFNKGNRLARRPENTFNATASYTLPFGLTAGATMRIVGDSFNDAGNTQVVESYTLVDFRLSYPVNEKLEVYARVENAFDERYETVSDYGTLPQLFYGGVRLRF
ncbi:vitamin B12 transporter [Altererythrobacter atlanticus]|uniref:Vitamin B12 transporter BtuB n=1 Tax=Croceibacterium atlanticum TaxID=1267766 RepID=A0A0F7KTG8_9SPHN|nr:TonB-dependent receptor [Croceibacterium atlanticum]AKH42869.1 Vitamin B12 transporter BtuB precursor [Croceibacterium atlanticum]MBB5731649.1 vitamin B12 transporter [Croceibacterium atlanticum]